MGLQVNFIQDKFGTLESTHMILISLSLLQLKEVRFQILYSLYNYGISLFVVF
ncbi:unnamed protein product [Paramecium primaurelia]|uniref:Uncharacterized protein n=1 Tax=Paramecium primaurelia TaxID=5886 RepID=A0A8S1N151_PARPR|nr:unnamed protein product [Paramecium primaurelia]